MTDLVLQSRGSAGSPEEAWCAHLTDRNVCSGAIPWTDFNSECSTNEGLYYDGVVALESIVVLVPGDTVFHRPLHFCIESLSVF